MYVQVIFTRSKKHVRSIWNYLIKNWSVIYDNGSQLKALKGILLWLHLFGIYRWNMGVIFSIKYTVVIMSSDYGNEANLRDKIYHLGNNWKWCDNCTELSQNVANMASITIKKIFSHQQGSFSIFIDSPNKTSKY